MKKQSLLILTAVALTASVALAQPTYAQNSNTIPDRETLVERIMKAFKLNENEVDKVVETYHSERQVEMQKNFETRLNALVTEGKVTNEQKTKILAKHAEMRANKPEFKEMTPEERKAERETRHAELEEWAQANGIDIKYLFMFGRGKNGGGMGAGKFKSFE